GGLGHSRALHALAIQGAVGGLQNAHVVLIEPLSSGPADLACTEVPLASDGSGVALALEQLAKRHLTRLEGVRRAPDDDGAEANPLRIASGDERRARGRARRLDQVLRQSQALAANRVDAWGRHAPDLSRAVGADVSVTDVVAQH